MARRKRSQTRLNVWPGYVDALSTLLMVVTFVMLVFVVGQQFLSAAITQREHSLESLKRDLDRLSNMLSLSQDQVKTLNTRNQELTSQYQTTQNALHDKEQQLAEIHEKEQTAQNSQLAQINSLNAQLATLTQQLQAITQALDVEKRNETAKDAQISDLGKKLNIALADKVNTLKRYRSEFFGRLRDLLKNQPGISVVGDRFVFQSEILFPVGSATLSEQGKKQINTLARTLREISSTIPADIPWVLRVDGHADRQPIHTAFPSNWELSSARAITVVKMLIADGIDPHHLAATGFSVYQPLDPHSTPQAYAHNRRIEFRLTDR
ncbi:peptidoglycan -binding protein [Saccharibacter sp. 17.LH.SD]|uniref:peptidoglycan -binding protein n=1 Tax=Saccharibacter sp. 17.LH.SD TaxID=2689393 RepID=UPI001371AFA5|nr:peptidoglycan -binding protein [Saccharibacter sp. 17.LH.SD]MXV43654.1 peptidoglycan -binding protein [Saccharibacter sp. 17.LH.SD]